MAIFAEKSNGEILYIMSKRVLVRLDGKGFYETLEKASEALGMAPGNISRAVSEGGKAKGIPMRWAERVYAVREKDRDWRVMVLNSRNTAYLPVSQIGNRVLARDVVEKRELTSVWYGTGFEGEFGHDERETALGPGSDV